MSRGHVVVVNWKDSAHPAAGGAEVFCESVAAELVQLGLRVTLLASRPAGTPARSSVDGYEVRRVGRTYTVYALVLLWLFRHRREIDAVIDSQNGIPFFTPLALRRSTAIVLLIHHVHQDQFALYFSPLMTRIGRWLESTGSRWVYGRRPVATVSPSSRTEVRRQLGLQGPIHIVPNGSSGGPAGPVAARSATPRIACVGRLVPHKRWHLLVQAVAQLRVTHPDLHVDLIGAGPEQDRLAELVTRLGLTDSVTLHGFVTRERRDELLARAWLTVSTSVGEGWGLSMIEAAALGVPAVAIDVPGLRDSVRHGVTGRLCAEDALADTLALALDELADPEVAAGFAARCRHWASSLRWSAGAERFHAIFVEEAHRLAQQRGRRAGSTDIATVVHLDDAAARCLDLDGLRATDQTTFCRACLTEPGPRRLLLHGCDELDAVALLAELGVDHRDHAVRTELCRAGDLLGWFGDGVAHSHITLTGVRPCPGTARPLAGSAPSRRSR